MGIENIVFIVIALASLGLFAWNINKIVANIKLGRSANLTQSKAQRWKTMIKVALGQSKMTRRPIAGIFHIFIYAAFVITQIELIEIFVDGISGSHRIFYPALGGFYTFVISLIEVLSVLALVATFIFLVRRNLLKIPRLSMDELSGWPKLDGNLILYGEVLLVVFIFMMNGADEVLQQKAAEPYFGFAVTRWIGPLFFGGMSNSALHIISAIGWWGHILVVFAFLNYLPYSKHFHILLAFPNTYYSNLNPKGKFNNMESVTEEVRLMMDPNADPFTAPEGNRGEEEEPDRFGAKDATDLPWTSLLDAYSCTECGRCTDACPANMTGKLLSPRKIMMDTRDRLEEIGQNKRKNGAIEDDGKALNGDYITAEELWACTTCNACVQECPVNIDPLGIIVDLRRYLIMEESKVPTELAGMLSNVENNQAPWQFSPEDRLKWATEE